MSRLLFRFGRPEEPPSQAFLDSGYTADAVQALVNEALEHDVLLKLLDENERVVVAPWDEHTPGLDVTLLGLLSVMEEGA